MDSIKESSWSFTRYNKMLHYFHIHPPELHTIKLQSKKISNIY